MSLFTDVKFFLKKYLKNPFIITAAAYVVHKIITKYTKKESLLEAVEIHDVKEDPRFTILFDTKTNQWLLIDLIEHDVWTSDTKDELEKMLKDKKDE